MNHHTPPRYHHRTSAHHFNSPIDLSPVATIYRTPPYCSNFPTDVPQIYDAYHVHSRSTGTESTRDPRIPQTSVFNLERLRNSLVNQDPRRSRDDVHHREQPIAATPVETRRDCAEERMSQLLKSSQDLVESMLAILLIKQSETRSMEFITPTPIVQNPVSRSEDVEDVSVQQVQELKKHVADQVFEETPQQSVEAADDDNDGLKSQKSETSPESALQLNHLSKVLGIQKVHICKSNEFEIDYDDKLEMSLCVKEVQDYSIVFPAIDTEEHSYVVVGNCNLNSIPMDVLHFSHEIRMDGEENEKIGVG